MHMYLNALFGLGLFIWMVFLMSSVMLFDAPGSTNSPLTLALFVSFISYPVLWLFGLMINFSIEGTTENHRKKAIVATLPALSIVAVVVCFVLIETLCDGKLFCLL